MECYLHNPILEHEEPVDEGILLMLKVSGICSARSIKKKKMISLSINQLSEYLDIGWLH